MMEARPNLSPFSLWSLTLGSWGIFGLCGLSVWRGAALIDWKEGQPLDLLVSGIIIFGILCLITRRKDLSFGQPPVVRFYTQDQRLSYATIACFFLSTASYGNMLFSHFIRARDIAFIFPWLIVLLFRLSWRKINEL